MVKRIFLLAFLVPFFALAQKGTLKGKVIDHATNEPIIGAYVFISKEYRSKAQLDGTYTIKDLPYGKYTLKISMFSYDTLVTTVTIDKPVVSEDFYMGDTQEMEEVEVIGQLAVDRKTPVAVSRISAKQITEELGSQELPMLLNSTPGVHATQQGGGDGDARISIRGFNQRNIGVMIDGVPVNDMENGAVYWSNWFGLDQITNQIQVQRGLGATKLAMPSVGGTMNIITQPTGGKQQIKVNQEYGTGNFLRTSLSYKSGKLKNGWGVLFSGSYKQGDGWVDGLSTRGAFYYLKIQKRVGKHLISLSGFGAPQEHAQRSYNQKIQYWDADYARDLGIEVDPNSPQINFGIQHNQHFGYYTDENGNQVARAERRNYYHKPQITLKDFWKVNDKLSISNMVYMSIGRGGGERLRNSSGIIYDEEGHVDWDRITESNQEYSLFGNTYPTVDPTHHPTLLKSSQVVTSSVNNHMWVGGVSQFDYDLNEFWNISGGLDYRYYQGEHYTELRDLLGGNYWINSQDQNASTTMKTVGDKVGWQPYHNHRDALVQWGGAFGQAEYSKGRWSTFVNLSTVVNGYKGIDYHQKRQIQLEDTILYIGGQDVVKYDGEYYHPDHPGLEYNQTEWKVLGGFTAKAGANFNITERMNVFVNAGYLSRTPQFSNVINNEDNQFFEEIANENIIAFEAGYGYRSKRFSGNVNTYYTMWKNKPFPYGVSVPDPNDPTEFVRANVNGMDALHMGIEFDGVYKITKSIALEGMVSLGDWTWQSSEKINVVGQVFEFDATGVHVGDAAQSTYAGAIRFEPIPRLYFKAGYTYFDRYYSDFDPFSLDVSSGNGGKESWQIPSYGLLSLHAGYRFKFQKSSLVLRGNVFNALNSLYISDARNNQNGSGFDAASAGVFFGQGVRLNFSLGFEF
ncbi:TonB-dependent receptor [Brumimicrobium aurantiacum]|uniref:TonB-dependent receptor n=1 Tax=Brumimicrobium aurantiacum TaxID=1737063 RepID=A0A3E1EZK2_9FLAO|nr:TonB-dependent receptor [Brumimicrobium aurantiacum]RFC54999.1 TonB-dependent receptor [Brumimicrobium aurantiacum]